MNDYYENIKNNAVCTECGSREMGIAYLHDNDGLVKNVTKVLGLKAYAGVGNVLVIVCKKCGFIVKSFVVAR
jgi:predicted nucleic-acid-binding Zn-ribbon protein